MKLPITEVIENVKDELLCYEGGVLCILVLLWNLEKAMS